MSNTATRDHHAILGAFCLLVIAILVMGFKLATGFSEFKELLNIVFGPIVALVSTAVGFYFGERKR